MAFVYVAKSAGLQKWGADVGLTKYVYLVGVAGEDADKAVEALNAGSHAGFQDWKLMKKQEVEAADEAAILATLARKEKEVDPNHYPRLRGARGMFKVKPTNVENHILVKQALAGREPKLEKISPAVIAGYLIAIAVGEKSEEGGGENDETDEGGEGGKG